jgi:hypothetical protein
LKFQSFSFPSNRSFLNSSDESLTQKTFKNSLFSYPLLPLHHLQLPQFNSICHSLKIQIILQHSISYICIKFLHCTDKYSRVKCCEMLNLLSLYEISAGKQSSEPDAVSRIKSQAQYVSRYKFSGVFAFSHFNHCAN